MSARTAKFIFILLAFGLTILLFYWPTQQGRLKLSTKMEPILPAEDLSRTEVGSLTSTIMEKPKFTGEDVNNKRWSLKADRAIQMSENGSDKVSLENVEASLTSSAGKSFLFSAKEGVFLSGEYSMSLNNNVKIKGYGYTLETESIQGNMNTHDLTSKVPVKIEGMKGDLTAGSFSMDGKTGKITLFNGVKMHLYLNRTEKTHAGGVK